MSEVERSSSAVTMADAINTGLDEVMANDDTALLLGEDVGRLGGVFRITKGLFEKYGDERVFDTPLSEAGFAGAAVGLALNGYRPMLEVQFDGFLYPALNQICTQIAKIPARIKDEDAMPVLIRIPVGGRIRASEMHSESPEAYLAHTPDLNVVAASNPRTARALLVAAARSDKPFVFLEPKRLYRRERIDRAEEVQSVDASKARVEREGDDALIITYGPMLDIALAAAAEAAEDGLGVGVLDLVSLAPIDVDTVLAEAAKSGRVVVATESIGRCSVAATVVAHLATQGFSTLKAAPRLLAAPDRPYPPARFEDDYLPSKAELIEAVKELQRD